jgi:protoheme IX farnesyltransferase
MKTLQSAAGSPGKPLTKALLLGDYFYLTKPRIVALLLLTTLVALFLSSTSLPSPALVVWTLLGGYFAAGGAGALNCALEGDIDHLMERTGKRAVAAGRIPAQHAFRFGLVLSFIAFVILATGTKLLAALLAMMGIVYYVLIYTHWLKRRTWLNIVIGGGAGAMPPLVGSAAATGSLTPLSLVLAGIIFLWSPPHFWTLALVKQKEYARANIPMLPLVAGSQATRKQIMLYSIGMVVLTLLLPVLSPVGGYYLLLAIPLNIIFLAYAHNTYRAETLATIRSFFRYTILYLAFLFIAIMMDHVLVQLI